MDKGEISPQIFLNRIVFQKNEICNNLDIFDDIDTGCDSDNEIEDDHDIQTQEEIVSNTPVLQLMPCCICMDRTSEVLMHPCGHLKVFADCWESMLNYYSEAMAKFLDRDLAEEYRPALRCPFCRLEVTEHTKSIYT